MYRIGDKIKDFSADVYQNEEIKRVKFSDYRGKWAVLFFYPEDFTFVCPTELEDAAEFYSRFQDINTEIISISTDNISAHKAWHDTSEAIGKVKYPMMADPTTKICRAFGTYIKSEGVSLRGTFIINPDGKLVAFDVHDNSIARNIEEIYRKLQAAQYTAEHGDQVCPARWTPGEKTLKPGVDLIGKI